MPHIPVLLKEVVESLQPERGGIYVDATFGGGGYTRALIEAGADLVVALDRDPSVERHLADMPSALRKKIRFENTVFSRLPEVLKGVPGAEKGVNGIVMDLGVSSFQLDEEERGFSFMQDGPLDMRMGSEGLTAADVVNLYSEEGIADILYVYGEEKKSRHLARAIVNAREEAPFTTTLQLANLIASKLGKSKTGKHPATRSFQALRIFVNKELEELKLALSTFPPLLAEDGVLSVVTFHSLEDRMVKRSFQEVCGRTSNGSRYLPPLEDKTPSPYRQINVKPIRPSPEEEKLNPRSRSASLRSIKSFKHFSPISTFKSNQVSPL